MSKRAGPLMSLLLVAGCAATPKRPCPADAQPGLRAGYEVVWTQKLDYGEFSELCLQRQPYAGFVLRPEVALLRGTGTVHLGSKLRSELEPRLSAFKLDAWSVSCRGKVYEVVLNAQAESCRVDQVIEQVGQYLRERDASDFVVLSMGLWAAPAL